MLEYNSILIIDDATATGFSDSGQSCIFLIDMRKLHLYLATFLLPWIIIRDFSREGIEMVLLCGELSKDELIALWRRYGVVLEWVDDGEPIPGSFWGECEAGLIGNRLLVRADTPLHSAFHEGCHYICMDKERRAGLHTDAGGGYDEENGVNYLQILLSDYISQCGKARMFADMDEWGYSFRLGSAKAWFEEDAEDARKWLEVHGLIENEQPTWLLRQ